MRAQRRAPKSNATRLVAAVLLGLLCGPLCCHALAGQLRAHSEASLNLGSILAQQQKLSLECRQLEESSLKHLKQVVAFERANERWLHMAPSDLANTVRMPAVCLLLNGPPGGAGAQKRQQRLDLVNWVFDADELAQVTGSNASSGAQVATRRLKRQSAHKEHNQVLSDYFFNVNEATEEEQQHSAKENQNEEQRFLEQYTKLLADERYKSALKPISERVASYLSPVVLVPGLAGSRLQARLEKQQRVNIICSKQSDWQDVWLSLKWFLPLAIDCWIDNARLVFDPSSGFAHEPPGVESRVPGFGSIESVRHLDLRSPKLTKYFDTIIERYTLLGYQPDKNLFAAPYDFRLAPQQLEGTYFVELKALIERAARNSQSSPKQKVTLVCHSMGCTHLLYFMRLQKAAWRQAKIRKIVALSSPWGGATKALKALLVGEQFGLPIVSESKIRDLARTLPSVAYLLPQAQVFGKPNKYQLDQGGPKLVETAQRSYTAAQLDELLRDANMTLQWQWFKATTDPLRPLEPLPDLHVDCLHSLNVPTPETMIFRNQTDFPDGQYELTYGDGDGTVNHQSLLICADWAIKLPARVRHKIVKNTSHMGMLNHKQVLDHITQDVTSSRNSLNDDDVSNNVV